MNSTKKNLRLAFKKLRNNIPQEVRFRASKKIARKLYSLNIYRSAKKIAIYLSTASEVETLDIFKKSLELKKIVLAPRVNPKNLSIRFHRIKSFKDLEIGFCKIFEPKKRCLLYPTKGIDLILAPGIAFDFKGYRLGYGKGIYDRCLRQINKEKTVGLSYEKTLCGSLPHQDKDIPVWCIVTEKRTILTHEPA